MESNAKFEGWAVVELFGHTKEVGYVASEYFGGAALFRIDVPELPGGDFIADRPHWTDGGMVPAGSTMHRAAVPGRTRFVGPSAIFALNPCTEEVARESLARFASRDIALVSLPEGKQLLAGEESDVLEDDSEEE